MHLLRIHLLFVVGLCASVTAVALAGSSRVFELPDHGALTLTVPDSWVDEMNRPANRLPPTILLRPGAAGSGEVLITAVWPIPPVTNISDEATIRSEVAEAAKKAASQSVERALPIPPGGRAADVGVGGGCYRNRVCGKEWNTHVERGGAPS